MTKKAPKEPIPSCEICRYFFPDDTPKQMKSDLGICRRYPPSVVGIDEDGFSLQSNPTVESDWICGEFYVVLNS